MFSLAVRFPLVKNAMFCPPPSKKNSKAQDYTESLGVLGIDPPTTYDINLHMAVAHMRRADGALPPHSRGRKPLDFLAGKGLARCVVSCARVLCKCMTGARAGTLFGPASQSTAGGGTTCGARVLGLFSVRFIQNSIPGLLSTSMSSSPAKSACISYLHILSIFAYFAYFY